MMFVEDIAYSIQHNEKLIPINPKTSLATTPKREKNQKEKLNESSSCHHYLLCFKFMFN
jgi:polysaccharide deacetylase 2 family uncharacterized protein YibQ